MKYLKIKDNVDLNVLVEKYGFQSRTVTEWGKVVGQFVLKGSNSKKDVMLVIDVTETPDNKSSYRIVKFHMNSSWVRRPIPAVLLQMMADGMLEEVELDY